MRILNLYAGIGGNRKLWGDEHQIIAIENGETIRQETFGWDAAREIVVLMRAKEESDDYRYFPEPDLIPLIVDDALISSIKRGIPELPRAKKDRLIKQYSIPGQNAEVLTATRELADYFEEAAKSCKDYRKISNWILGEVLMVLKEKKISIDGFSVPPEDISELVSLIENGTISGKIAKDVFQEMVETGDSPKDVIKKKGLEQIADGASIEKTIDAVLTEHHKEVTDYINGKEKLYGFFVGQIMKATHGKANPGIVNRILKEKLNQMKS